MIVSVIKIVDGIWVETVVALDVVVNLLMPLLIIVDVWATKLV